MSAKDAAECAKTCAKMADAKQTGAHAGCGKMANATLANATLANATQTSAAGCCASSKKAEATQANAKKADMSCAKSCGSAAMKACSTTKSCNMASKGDSK